MFSSDQDDGDGRLPPESMIMELSPEAFNPHWPMIDDHVFDWAAGLSAAIKSAGAKTVLYMTWARLNAPDSQQAITDAYTAIGKSIVYKPVTKGIPAILA